MSLPIANLWGQTYDAATIMLSHKKSVAKQTKEEQPKALETNCHRHPLSLSVKETTTSLREKFPNTELFLVCIFGLNTEIYGKYWSEITPYLYNYNTIWPDKDNIQTMCYMLDC